MKILIVGSWSWDQYENSFSRSLLKNNFNVLKFSTSEYFKGFIGRLFLFFPFPGYHFLKLNRDLLDFIIKHNPDYVLFWRTTHVAPYVIKKINQKGIITLSYNNDDPFGPYVHGKVPYNHYFLWFWYLKCLPFYKKNFFYRKINCSEALDFGAKHASVLLPYFIPEKDFEINLLPNELNKFKTDVVFAGHYENDKRIESVRALIEAGIKLKIWGGPSWSKIVLGDLYEKLQPITLANGIEYAKALSGAKICLVFLSKINRDSYTRRCFEIPACGRVMLAERTKDLQEMFKENEEACFFSSNDELVEKVRWLLDNPEIRNQIANAGLKRVWSDGHFIDNRVKQFINELYK
jgi:spore maturation protein CgeB